MFDHFRGFGAHEEHLRGEGGEQFGEQRFLGIAAEADDDALGFFKGVEGFAEAEIFRRIGKVKLGKFLFQGGAGADGQLRGNQHEGAGGQMGQGAAQGREHGVHIRFVIAVDGGIVGEPEDIGLGAGGGGIVREGKFFGGESGGEEFVQAGFEQRGLALVQAGDVGGVEVQSGDLKMPGAAGGGDAAEMPEAKDGDVHFISGCGFRTPTGFAATIGGCGQCPARW